MSGPVQRVAFSYDALRMCASTVEGRKMLVRNAAACALEVERLRKLLAAQEEILKRVELVLGEVRV
jgi:hypothetical protein